MQQTEKYRFNLIEGSDPFSAQPLNDNMAKTEGALSALGAKVAALPRIVTGSYTGAGTYSEAHPNILEFPDAERPPALILVSDINNSVYGVMIRGMKKCLVFWDTYLKYYVDLTWTDKGVRWYSASNPDFQFNNANTQYSYVAFI